MDKSRLASFSDCVISILITIMVFDIKAPAGSEVQDLLAVAPAASVFVLSFLYLGIYWNNHHHLLHLVGRINGTVLWANLHLLFWLSLFPFVTSWLGKSGFALVPAIVYGAVLLAAGISFLLLKMALIQAEGEHSKLQEALGFDLKGKISLALYAAGIVAAFFDPRLAVGIYTLVTLMWFVPDRRIENQIN